MTCTFNSPRKLRSHFSALILPALLSLCSFTAPAALAGPGHDHGDAHASTKEQTSPRFAAQSELFEVVGILNGQELSIYVDRFADNTPVRKARVEVESGGLKASAEYHAEHGDYSIPATAFTKPGNYPITLTIAAGDEVDILAANLVVPDAHDDAAHASASAAMTSARWAGLLIAAGVLLAIGAWLILRRRANPRPVSGV